MSAEIIYTIGYGHRPLSDFINILQKHHIDFLIDVRTHPHSRHQTAYNQPNLRQQLRQHDIRYVFMGDTLGGRPQDPSCYPNGTIDYHIVAEKPFYQEGISRLQNAHSQKLRIALMCAEAKPENCHRLNLISHTLHHLNIPLQHIDEADNLCSHQEILARLNQLPTTQTDDFINDDLNMPPPPPSYIPELDDHLIADFDELVDYDTDNAPQDIFDFMPANFTPVTIPDGPRDLNAAQKLLKQIFGYDNFRPLQAEIIDNILNGHDALAIMPTGSGKSLCYQLPALLFDGLTIVVSPLISLMEDQVMQLRELGLNAVALNSSLSYPEYQWNLDQIRQGHTKLLYVAPETLLRPQLQQLLTQVDVACFTIDEAHCISEWGHDFRPEYRQLTAVRQQLPNAVCLAVTATATEQVRTDIKQSLSIPDADEFVASFNRENLFLAVAPKTGGLEQTLAFLNDHQQQSGIIYCTTRRQVDQLTQQLQSHGWDALPYHAGLNDADRRLHQQKFIRDDVPIIVATIAFGMGINKSNVRFILHYDLPKNLESYYQQIGRAGRDGLRSDCLLLYSYSDVNTINFFINKLPPDQQEGARHRLQAMLDLTETNECRRQPLLNYFDEEYDEDNCDMCDTCTRDDNNHVDLTIPAQKFLSCVKRTGEYYGLNHIIDVLRGSRAKKIIEKGHHRLSTYNIGADLSKKEWQHLGRQFIQQGLLNQDMTYGSLKLTSDAYAVFKGEQTVHGTLLPKPRHTTTSILPHDAQLFARLRTQRKQLADSENVPPYIIFSDRALVEMSTYFPHSRASLLNMTGVGESKVAKYADIFLPIIVDYCAQNNLQEQPKTAVTTTSTRPVKGQRTFEVLELFNNGQSIPQIANHFQVKESTIISHLWKATKGGHPLHHPQNIPTPNLNPNLTQQALDAFKHHGIDQLRPVFDQLNGRVSFDDLHLLRLHAAYQTTLTTS
ncbi:MAG TPA: DNA helicase RecQ [Anaerolineae bacterium]|nr:DNA helicase RecQ [Anaerolineae bacterium]